MDKFGRSYELQIRPGNVGPTIIIRPPLTLEIDVQRNTLASANVAQFRIYNLNQNTRGQIRYNVSNYGEYWPIKLVAGYGENGATVFQGNVSQAWSVREGNNFITQIECYDGGFAFNNGYLDSRNGNFPAGTPENVMFGSMITRGLPNITLGAIGNFPELITRGASFIGPTVKILEEITGNAFFVDNEKAFVLKTDEVPINEGSVLLINADSGLLNTPVLEKNIARFEMLFEPQLKIGRTVQIRSSTDFNFNGTYKITAVQHRGMISEAVCGSLTTTGEFFFLKSLDGIAGIL